MAISQKLLHDQNVGQLKEHVQKKISVGRNNNVEMNWWTK